MMLIEHHLNDSSDIIAINGAGRPNISAYEYICRIRRFAFNLGLFAT